MFDLGKDVEQEAERDSLGGNGAVASGIYQGKVELVYLDKSVNGAKSVNIHFNNGDRTLRQTVYISNRAGGFTYQRDGKNHALPGYSQMDAFFKALTGKGIAAQETEEKTFKLYSFDEGKEIPQKKLVFTDCTNVEIAIGVLQISEEKTVLVEGEVDAKGKPLYEGTGEFREINEFDKYFDSENGMTAVEKAAGVEEAVFIHDWKKKNVGNTVIRKATNQPKGGNGTAGAPAAGGGKPKESLFGKKAG